MRETNIFFTGPFHVSCSDDYSEQFFEEREKHEVCMVLSYIACDFCLVICQMLNWLQEFFREIISHKRFKKLLRKVSLYMSVANKLL